MTSGKFAPISNARAFPQPSRPHQFRREVQGMDARRILGLTLVLLAIAAAVALHFLPSSAAPAVTKAGDVSEERIAADAVTGKLIWKYDPQIRLDQALNGSYSARTNGGVAVWNGKVYVGTGDCRLIAIDAATANKVWEATVCEPTQTGITGAPHVAKGKILMGFNGSDDAVRGALATYDAETGI